MQYREVRGRKNGKQADEQVTEKAKNEFKKTSKKIKVFHFQKRLRPPKRCRKNSELHESAAAAAALQSGLRSSRSEADRARRALARGVSPLR